MNNFRDLLNDLEAFEKCPENAGVDLRLDLAGIILGHLDGKEWTQAKLADAAGMKSSYLNRVIHGSQNCTFDIAGKICTALGVRLKLVDAGPLSGMQQITEATSVSSSTILDRGITNGQEINETACHFSNSHKAKWKCSVTAVSGTSDSVAARSKTAI